jgi:hypothetical protein
MTSMLVVEVVVVIEAELLRRLSKLQNAAI